MQAFGRNPIRILNVEQGISNDEVKSLLLFPSAFVIRYSIFCGSLLSFCAACGEVTGKDPKTRREEDHEG
jgi:hypothetical protein